MATTQPTSYSTHAIDYTISTRATLFSRRVNRHVQRRCTLAKAAITNGEPLRIPCSYCSGSPNTDAYVGRYQQLLNNLLLYHFPFISNCCAERVVDTFTSTVLVPANDAHNCPYRPLNNGINVVTHFSLHEANIMVYDHQEGSFDEEDGLRARPADPATVMELRVAKIMDDFKKKHRPWSVVDRECAICMEPMETRESSLKMPCSHVFHESCIVEWLKNGSTCPLCRYEMPHQD